MSPRIKPIVLMLVSVVLCQQMRAQQTNAYTTIRINLKKFGWLPHAMQVGEYELSGQPLVIDRENRVWVGFTVRDDRQGLDTREHPSLSFHMLRFDARGNLDLSLAIPTNSWHDDGVYLDAADDVLAQANDKIQVLTASDEVHAAESSWRILAPCGRSCEVKQSVSRGTLVLQDLATAAELYVLQGSPPNRVEHCSASSFDGFFNSLTDDFAYYYHDSGNPPMPPPVFYRWPFCDFSHRSELPINLRIAEVRALNDNSFLVAHAGKLAIYDANGNVKREVQMRMAKHESGGARGQMSDNGDRVAISVSTWKGGFPALDIGSHMVAQRVIVYDLAEGDQLVSVPVSPVWFFLPLVMSPDGHRVAFLVKGILTIVDVP